MAWRVCLVALVTLLGFAHEQLLAQGVVDARHLAWPLARPMASSQRPYADRSPDPVGDREPPMHSYSPGGAAHSQPSDRGDGNDRAADVAGTYRTLCVRTCDGYYFPLSFSIPRSGLARDADMCNASCGGEARLFYHANPGGDVESMVDLTGRAYINLPTAFKYRQTLVDDCRCRPQPWSAAEQSRHRNYAQPGAVTSSQTESAANSLAAPEKGVAASDEGELGMGEPPGKYDPGAYRMHDWRILARPAPVARDVGQLRPWLRPSPYGSDWVGDAPGRSR
jgi:hypothetical protein